MRLVSLALAALFLAALSSPASACDRPFRTFIANHRPGIVIPKPVYGPPTVTHAAPSYPTGGVIVQTGGCATGNCPLSR